MHVRIYIYIYTYLYLRLFAYMNICKYIYIYMYIDMYIRIYIFIYVSFPILVTKCGTFGVKKLLTSACLSFLNLGSGKTRRVS